MLNGLLNLPWWGVVAIFLVVTHFTVIGVTVYLHRHQAHRALDLHPAVCHFFRFYLWLTTGMSTRAWVSIHRKHHSKCETEEDPHSPQILGLKKVVLEGAELYRKEAKNEQTLKQYSKGTPDDWLERKLYSKHSVFGIGLMLVIDLVLFGIPGLSFWALQMIWIPFWAAGIVNGVGHYWGYRNFECADASRNVLPIGLIMGGEELHNNHHTYPLSAKLSVKWWEFDIGWGYVRLFEILGLAKVKRTAPKPHFVETPKPTLDADTVKAIVSNRFHVMAGYCKKVTLPVLRSEKRHSNPLQRRLLRRNKHALVRDDILLDSQRKEQLDLLLNENDKLRTVYQLRLKLQEIWTRTTNNQKELLDALQDWCKQAEATGIEALRDYVHALKRYSLKPAPAAN